MPNPPFISLIAAFLAIFSGFATAHEYWIDPTAQTHEVGTEITANIRVGQLMRGSTQAYNKNAIKQMGVVVNGTAAPISSRLGDRPAIKYLPANEGLHIFAVETNASTLVYQEFAKFQKFVETHGEGFAVQEHLDAKLPDNNFREAYFRFAKALVPVGTAQGADQSVRFPFELVAVENPFQSKATLKFVLLFEGEPAANHQIDVFNRPIDEIGDAAMVSYETNDQGVVEFPRGSGDYLINAVKLMRPTAGLAESLNVVWVSLWASTTFTLN